MPTKEARFTAKKDSKCDIDTIKQAVKNAGYTVSAVKAPKGAESKLDTPTSSTVTK